MLGLLCTALLKAFQNFSLQIFACSRVDSAGHSMTNLSFHWLELSCTSQDPNTTSPTKWLWRPWAVWTPTGPVPFPGRTAVTCEAQNKHVAHWIGSLEGPSEQTPCLVTEAIHGRKPGRRPAVEHWVNRMKSSFLPQLSDSFLVQTDDSCGLELSSLFFPRAISFYFGQAAMDWRTPLGPQSHFSFWKEPMWASWRTCPQASGCPHLSRSSSQCLPVEVKVRACWKLLAMSCFLQAHEVHLCTAVLMPAFLQLLEDSLTWKSDEGWRGVSWGVESKRKKEESVQVEWEESVRPREWEKLNWDLTRGVVPTVSLPIPCYHQTSPQTLPTIPNAGARFRPCSSSDLPIALED